MIIKATTGGGTVRLFDNVTRLVYSDKNNFSVCPSLSAANAKEGYIYDYAMGAFGRSSEKVEEYDMSEETAKHVYPLNGDEDKPRRIDRPLRNYESETEIFIEFEDDGDFFLFIGKTYEDERFCFKKMSFYQNGVKYHIITENPVYVCNDTGKTIEVIK